MPDFSFNPDKLKKLLQAELDGTLPPEVQSGVDELRRNKVLPPGLLDSYFPKEVGRVGNPAQPNNKLPEIPSPSLGLKGNLQVLPSEMADAGRAAWPAVKGVASALTSPEALGAMGAGLKVAKWGTPEAAAVVGGVTGGITAARKLYNRATDPEAAKQPLSADIPDIAASFFSGGAGEIGGRGLNAMLPIRRTVTPQGNAAAEFFGRDKMMANQLADSAPLNFMANVAKHGPSGEHIIKDMEDKQSQHVLDYLKELSGKLNNNGGISIDHATGEFNQGMAGKNAQRDIAGQMDTLRHAPADQGGSGFKEFLGKYGDSHLEHTVTDPLTGEETIVKSKTAGELHKLRSKTLDASRDAYRSNDLQGQAQLLGKAERLGKKIDKVLPDDVARQEYQSVLGKYNTEINRLDNPTAAQVRTGRSEDVIDNILNNSLKNYAPMGEKVGQTNDELLKKVQTALSPKAWNQLQADTVHRIGDAAINPDTGNVSAKLMRAQLDKLDSTTKERLFGKALDGMHVALSAVEQAQKFNQSDAGRLFIAIKYGSASINALSGAAAAAGTMSGHPLVGAGTAMGILISPYAFARLLTSKAGQTILTRAATAAPGTAQAVAKQALTRWVAQNVTEHTKEAAQDMMSKPTDAPTSDYNIPNPPK